MPRVVHFEIPADDLKRARSFYEKVFGWKFNKYEGPMEYWLVSTGENEPGIDGGLMPRPQPGAGTVNTVGVPSVDDYIAKVKKAGGQIVVDKTPIPGVGWFANCIDTEGNVFGIMEPDESVK